MSQKGHAQRSKAGSTSKQAASKSMTKPRQSLADTLSKLRELLDAEPAAEELACNWTRFKPLATALDGAARAPVGVPLLVAVSTSRLLTPRTQRIHLVLLFWIDRYGH